MGANSNCINCTTPGFRFHPTDAQLINHLKNRLIGLEPRGREIAEVADLSKFNPQELSRFLSSGTSVDDDDDKFCYWKPVHKNNGVSRTAKGGFWKPTGKVRPIKARGTREKIGEKRTLVFHLGKSSGKVKPSQRTPWVIHEYYWTITLPDQTEKVVKDLVVCKLKLKDDGKTVISCKEVSESSHHLPSSINGLDDRTCLQLPSNSTLAKPSVEEPVVENPEVVPDKVSAKGACESIRNSPHQSGDSAAEDVTPEEDVGELLARLEFPNDCNVGDGYIPPLQLVPQEQMPACKNTGQSVNSQEDNDLGSFLKDWNEGSLRDGSNQLMASSRKRSHDEDDGLSCVTDPETPQAKRVHVVCFSKNGADEKICHKAFPEDEQGGLHMTSGLQNNTSEYNEPEEFNEHSRYNARSADGSQLSCHMPLALKDDTTNSELLQQSHHLPSNCKGSAYEEIPSTHQSSTLQGSVDCKEGDSNDQLEAFNSEELLKQLESEPPMSSPEIQSCKFPPPTSDLNRGDDKFQNQHGNSEQEDDANLWKSLQPIEDIKL